MVHIVIPEKSISLGSKLDLMPRNKKEKNEGNTKGNQIFGSLFVGLLNPQSIQVDNDLFIFAYFFEVSLEQNQATGISGLVEIKVIVQRNQNFDLLVWDLNGDPMVLLMFLFLDDRVGDSHGIQVL